MDALKKILDDLDKLLASRAAKDEAIVLIRKALGVIADG